MKPTINLRNIIAFVGEFGDFPRHCHYASRSKARNYEDGGYRWVRFNADYKVDSYPIRFYLLSDEAREIAAGAPLAKCLAFLKERGFKAEHMALCRRRPKLNYIPFVNVDEDRRAFISSGRRVYMSAKGSWKSELAFEI